MRRILYATVGGLVVMTTMHVTAQQLGEGGVPRSTLARATPGQIPRPRILPGTPANVFSAIQGNALNSTNAPMGKASVRLRDARVGQIVATQVTDEAGIFAFRTIDPGSYIVEIMGQDQYSVLAASQILNVGAGEAVSAIVKLPFQLPVFGGGLVNANSSAAAVTAQAASAGVSATQAQGAPTCDITQ